MNTKMKLTSLAVTAILGATIMVPLAHSSCTSDKGSDGQFFTVAQREMANTDFTKAAESTINGVVSIKSFVSAPSYSDRRSQGGFDMFDDPFFEFFFGGRPQQRRQESTPKEKEQKESEETKRPEQQLGLGSGVIVSEDGYIVTNNHVIDGAERLEVTLNDNRTFDAKVIGTDPTTDLALIKIEESGLPVIPIGDSDELKVGEWVLAVGNPFGFTSTVTTGIVSAKARSISSVTHNRSMGIESFIQTDAAVNPGNSGGALVNLNGHLVGINTAIYSNTGSYSGYSFAIPTSIVKKVIKDLRQYGAVQRAVLGISISDLNAELAREKGITATQTGVYVAEVGEKSAAGEAGIKAGDVIVALNGKETRNVASLQESVSQYAPGEEVTVTYFRDNKKQTAKVKLLNSKGNTKATAANTFDQLGATFKAVDDETKEKLRIRSGVQVTDVANGRFKKAGIPKGFIVLVVNDYRVRSVDDIKKIYDSVLSDSDSDPVLFITGITPDGDKRYFAVPIED